LTFDWKIVNGKAQFVESIETYHIFYNKELFDTFDKRLTTNQTTNKICFVVDIPTHYLKLVDLENPKCLVNDSTQFREGFIKLLIFSSFKNITPFGDLISLDLLVCSITLVLLIETLLKILKQLKQFKAVKI